MTLMKKVLAGFSVLFIAVLGYLAVILFTPVLKAPPQPITKRKREDGDEPPAGREDVQFSVAGQIIRAHLYLPQNTPGAVPCLIMSQGFGGTKDCILEKYALRFNAAGIAVLAYDYRHFGESDGKPRQLFDTLQQLDDLRAAVAYARERDEIDPEKIILWGTSASGGYGVIIAAEDERIAAVIAQCAGLDHDADGKLFMEREGWGALLRLLVHAQRDKGRSRLGLSPHMMPIAGRPGTVAMFSAPGAFEGYASVVNESETFENAVCARLMFMGHGRDPREAAADVQCPVLLLVCEQDNLVAPDSHVKVAEALGDKATVVTYPIGHFDIYVGQHFENAISEKLAFLQNNL